MHIGVSVVLFVPTRTEDDTSTRTRIEAKRISVRGSASTLDR